MTDGHNIQNITYATEHATMFDEAIYAKLSFAHACTHAAAQRQLSVAGMSYLASRALYVVWGKV
jgi:hypothetical protein